MYVYLSIHPFKGYFTPGGSRRGREDDPHHARLTFSFRSTPIYPGFLFIRGTGKITFLNAF